VDARLEVDKLSDKLGIEPPEGDFNTVGGLLLEALGRIPSPGEKVTVGEMELTVLRADGRRIKQVRLRKLPQTEEDEGKGD